MKQILNILGILVMVTWGSVLYQHYEFGMGEYPVLYTIGILIHSFMSVLALYATYHRHYFSRTYCWHCFSGEHDTCRRSDDARIESRMYRMSKQ